MELTIDQALQQGVVAHKAGRLQEAENLYKAIIQTQPHHSDANHNLGVLTAGIGHIELALPYFKTALEANPNHGQYWLSYIDALITLGKLDDAKELLRRGKKSGLQGDKVVELETRLSDTTTSSSVIHPDPDEKEVDRLVSLYTGGNLDEALIQGNALAKRFPNNAVIPNIIGAVYFGLGQYKAAVLHYGKSIGLRSDDASVHNNLGVALKELGN